jgi:hypothetical protein
MPNFGYHFARWKGGAVRRLFAAMMHLQRPAVPRAGEVIPLDVFSYSSEASLPEQVVSIRSFLRHAGLPHRFVVVSDGSHSTRSIELLKAIHPVVSVQQARDRISGGLPSGIQCYVREHPTGKQLAVIMSLPEERPALYVDSDVLFFPRAASGLRELARRTDTPALYLADCGLSADERLFRSSEEKAAPVNTGVLLLFQRLDWSAAIQRFLELEGPPVFFTNQTMTHLAMHMNRASPFNEKEFVLQLDDQTIFRDAHASADLVLRHYVNPVRHKFWATSLGR